jgi:regulatory protein
MEHKENKFKVETGTVKARIQAWCAYQERSQHETRHKLQELGLAGAEADALICDLINDNFLNEQRFANAFAGGKFRVKQWGRVKIKVALKAHRVSDACLRNALASISPDDYTAALRKIAGKKITANPALDRRKKYGTAFQYLVRRGFEADLVADTLNQLLGEINNYEFRT